MRPGRHSGCSWFEVNSTGPATDPGVRHPKPPNTEVVMNEDSEFLAAFLAEPDQPTTRFAYLTWLEERRDPRGEYLRLLTGLDEPTDPDGGPARQRLRALRGQIASDWADNVDRTRL